jgi:uncharacterized protein YbjT (DUF2867 family)
MERGNTRQLGQDLGGPVLVTGALGFVASRLVPRLLERGTEVVGLVRPGRDASGLEVQGIEVRRADLQDVALPADVFAGVHRLVHLAGVALVPHFLAALERAGVRRGVFVSSAGVHTRIESSSADVKRRAEACLHGLALEWVILRPTMIFGLPGDRNLERLLRWLRRFPVLPMPRGEALQQPVHVDDLVDAIVSCLERPVIERRTYDIGGREALSLRTLIRESAHAVGRRPLLVPVPVRLTAALVRQAWRMGLQLPVRPEQVLRLGESKAVDIGPARRELGFSPRSFREGIRTEAAQVGGHE